MIGAESLALQRSLPHDGAVTQSHPRSSDAPDPGDFLGGLAWDLILLGLSVVAVLWERTAGGVNGAVVVIGIVVALAAAKTVNRVLEHNRGSGH